MSQTAPASDWLPLSLAQADFWQEFLCHRDRALSTVAHCVEFGAGVQPQALQQAIVTTLQETDVFALQLRLPAAASLPQQRVNPACAPALRRLDLQHGENPQHAARQLMQQDIDKPLDLLQDPLAASWLIQLAPDRFIWYIRAHHIIIDGFAMSLIEHRCATLYRHALGEGAAGEPLNAFPAFLDEELTYDASPRCLKDRRYWQERVAGAGLPVLSTERDDYCVAPLHAALRPPAAFSGGVQQLAQRCDIGWPDLLMALSAAWLSQALPERAGDPYAPFTAWAPLMNRRGRVAGYVPALAVNTLPLRLQLRPEQTLGDWLAEVAGSLQRLRACGRYRIEKLAADCGLASGSRFLYAPLINVMPFDPPNFFGCETARSVMASGNVDGCNLSWRARTDGSELELDLDASPALFHAAELAEQGAELLAFIGRALEEGALQRRVGELL